MSSCKFRFCCVRKRCVVKPSRLRSVDKSLAEPTSQMQFSVVGYTFFAYSHFAWLLFQLKRSFCYHFHKRLTTACKSSYNHINHRPYVFSPSLKRAIFGQQSRLYRKLFHHKKECKKAADKSYRRLLNCSIRLSYFTLTTVHNASFETKKSVRFSPSPYGAITLVRTFDSVLILSLFYS